MKQLLIACITSLMLTNCATGYQPQSYSGGYSDTQYTENTFKVSFNGNGYTSKEKADDYLLLRSSELALLNGYKFFSILEGQSKYSITTYKKPIKAKTESKIRVNPASLSNDPYVVYSPVTNTDSDVTVESETTYSGGDTELILKPTAFVMIECSERKSQERFSYDVKILYHSLVKKYNLEYNPQIEYMFDTIRFR